MATNNTASTSTGTTGQRRTRPHSYTPQACERCRTRKQRCIAFPTSNTNNTTTTTTAAAASADQDGGEEMPSCKSCVDSGSVCVYAPRLDPPKRPKRESSPQVRSEDDDSSPGQSQPHSRSRPPPSAPLPPSIPIPSQIPLSNPPHSSPTQTFSFNPTMRPFAMSAPADPRFSLSAIDTNQTISSWQTTLAAQQQAPAPISDVDWRLWLTQVSPPQMPNNPIPPVPPTPLTNPIIHQQSMPPTQPATHAQTQVPTTSFAPVPTSGPSRRIDDSHASDHSPGAESDENSVFETAKGLAMISLEAAAEPHYIGESSGSLWTTLIARSLHTPQTTAQPRHTHPKPSRSPSPARRAVLKQNLARCLPQDVAAYVLETVYCHLHARYPFMDWITFEKHWQMRDDICLAIAQGRPLDKNTSVAAFFILMILAIGSQYCKAQNIPELLRPHDYFLLATPYLSYIVQLHNLANVQGLLLLAVYSLRDSRGPAVWHLSGLCVRLSIALGLHRNPAGRTARVLSKYAIEMRKRVFWTCYTIDRMMSMLLGRPQGISDDDIDVDLPDINNPTTELSLPVMRNGSMVSSVHFIKLKRIESQIHRSVYSIANRKPNRPASDFWPLLNMIDQWENEIPEEATTPQSRTVPCCSKEWFQLRAIESRLSLLRPLCMDQQESPTVFLPLLAQNAARGCELQKRAHQQGTPLSGIANHSTFICGLALLYSVFLNPSLLPMRDVFSAIKAASNTLFAYSQHEPTAGALYDIFEALSSACMDRLSEQSRNSPHVLSVNAGEWQKVSTEATSNIDTSSAGEYVDLLRTLGIDIDDQSLQDSSSWDLPGFSPGNLLFNYDQSQSSNGQLY